MASATADMLHESDVNVNVNVVVSWLWLVVMSVEMYAIRGERSRGGPLGGEWKTAFSRLW